MGRINHKSFTLIELIVAVGIVALILPSIFNIFFIMIRQQIVLIAYQDMQRQGNSIQKNIQNVLRERALQITDVTYLNDACPIITTPTPTIFPALYVKDLDGNTFSIYQSSNRIASDSGKQYFLNSNTVVASDLGFTCYRVNDFSPAYVTIKFTITKSALFKSVSLPYSFSVKLKNF